MLWLRRYERKEIENRRFRSNAVTLIQNFRYKGSPSTNNFCMVSWANECLTTLPLTVFTQRNFVAGFLQAKCDFKRRPMNALQLCPWQFSHRCYGWGATSKNRSQVAISLQRGHFDSKFQVEGVTPSNHFRTVSKANECLTTLPLTVFTQSNFVADFL